MLWRISAQAGRGAPLACCSGCCNLLRLCCLCLLMWGSLQGSFTHHC